MENKTKIILLTLLLTIIALILQSTLLNLIAINGIKPDLCLIIIIFVAYRSGSMTGQLSGFFSGIVEDFISVQPLGFYALIKTIIGFLYGLLKGNIIIDKIIMPLLFSVVATLLKGLLLFLISLIFSISKSGNVVFNINIFIEILYNAILTPIIFLLLNTIKIYRSSEKES